MQSIKLKVNKDRMTKCNIIYYNRFYSGIMNYYTDTKLGMDNHNQNSRAWIVLIMLIILDIIAKKARRGALG